MKKFALNISFMALALGLLIPQVARCDDGQGDAAEVESGEAVDSGNEGAEILDNGGRTPVVNGHADHGVNGHAVRNGVHFPEWAHHRYLQSRDAAHAEYTNRWNQYHAMQSPWHGQYYNANWGRPLALVVPPTADNQVKWGWGVGATEVVPIYHQFHRGNPATYPPAAWGQFLPTPYWPSHTDQFGVYPVRGPW